MDPVKYTRVLECGRDVPIGPMLVVNAVIDRGKVRLEITVDGELATRIRASGLEATLSKSRPWRKLRSDK